MELSKHFTSFSKLSSPSPVPNPQSPNPKSKGLGVTIKSYGPPTPPITFKHEGVLWYKSANSKSGSE